jgi:hypothetical protein
VPGQLQLSSQELKETALSIKGGHTGVYKLFYGELKCHNESIINRPKVNNITTRGDARERAPDGKLYIYLRQVYYLYIYADAGKLSLYESAQIKRWHTRRSQQAPQITSQDFPRCRKTSECVCRKFTARAFDIQ